MLQQMTRPINPATAEAHRFLEAVYGDCEEGHILIWAVDPESGAKRSYWFSVTDLEGAARNAVTLSEWFHVYRGCGLRAEAMGRYKRGGNDDVIAIPGLWADIDIAGPNHKRSDLPQSLDDARKLVAEFPLLPTVAIHSGGGVYCDWLFKEPWYFDTPDERRKAQQLLRLFTATLNAKAAQHGWVIDSTHDLSRVLRVPGTLNRKQEPVPVRILALHESRRYNPEEFEPFLIDPATLPKTGGGSVQHTGKPADLDHIAQECRWLRHCRDDAATLAEPEWYAMLSIVGRCVNGDALVHEWSGPYPDYRPENTDEKLTHALKDSGPRTCQNIQLISGGSHCVGCPHRGRVTSPIVLGNGWQAVNPYRRPKRLHMPAVPPLSVLRGSSQ